MQHDLWRLRQEKRWTINELAAESNVPALSIYEYEQGRPIRAADLPKLTQALEVAPDELKVTSDPKPRKAKAGRPQRGRGGGPKRPPQPKPAAESQIKHLIALGVKLGISQEEIEEEVGQPLEKLDRREIKEWLTQYTERITERKQDIASDPAGTKRWRAHLPEGVDTYELDYLRQRQKDGSPVTFTLFNEQVFTGRVIGFGPYNITIRDEDGRETTLQKLAIAYYHSDAAAGAES
jgi:DNA-binding Xre family transcriptional regulator/sRNA-binding regulator protein Hfq